MMRYIIDIETNDEQVINDFNAFIADYQEKFGVKLKTAVLDEQSVSVIEKRLRLGAKAEHDNKNKSKKYKGKYNGKESKY